MKHWDLSPLEAGQARVACVLSIQIAWWSNHFRGDGTRESRQAVGQGTRCWHHRRSGHALKCNGLRPGGKEPPVYR